MKFRIVKNGNIYMVYVRKLLRWVELSTQSKNFIKYHRNENDAMAEAVLYCEENSNSFVSIVKEFNL